MKNKEGYPDPTAAQAIAHIRRQEKRRKREGHHEPSTAKKTNSDAKGEAQT